MQTTPLETLDYVMILLKIQILLQNLKRIKNRTTTIHPLLRILRVIIRYFYLMFLHK